METSLINQVVQQLRRTGLSDYDDLTDTFLLSSFVERKDDAAFAALMRRHGAMVFGVCRRLLPNLHDAEDAFQATFLVLARKAASVAPRHMVGNWLYGVAYQTAVRVRATVAKRGWREKQVKEMPEPNTMPPDPWSDLQALLDQELSRLPDKYRVPIVLCDLEGKSQKDAARQLGWPQGTLSGRLTRARVKLAKRLAQCGLALSGGALAELLTRNAAEAAVPALVMNSTIRAATQFAAEPAAASGAISTQVAAITEGMLKAMLLTKLKYLVVGVFLAGVVGFGMTWWYLPSPTLHGSTSHAAAAFPGEPIGEAPNPGAPKAAELALYEIQVQLIPTRPKAQDAADAKFQQRVLLPGGLPVKFQLSPASVSVGAAKRDPMGIFVRTTVSAEKPGTAHLEFALEDVGVVEGKVQADSLVRVKEVVALGVEREYTSASKATPGLKVKLTVKKLQPEAAAPERKKDADEKPEALGKDQQRLQGVWEGTLDEISGTPSRKDAEPKVWIHIKGDSLTLRGPVFGVVVGYSATVDTKFKFAVNEAMAPKQLDMTIVAGPEDLASLSCLGLYALDHDRDSLVVCLNVPNKKRPTELKTQAGTRQMLLTLQRDPNAIWKDRPTAEALPTP